MNELIKRLSAGNHPVEANRPDKEATALKERIDMNYVHILFKNTGTEVGITLDKESCNFTDCDFYKGEGKAHLEGALTLNYDKVRCVAEIDLKDMHGVGYLEPLDDAAYAKIVGQKQ
ncbi:MAG: MbtH domain protein [Cytophagales bacterium]|nr:MbtH domain protein [Cytophagales bacterium]